jgi:glycosyltransferase involved in cell wall biosynthesis
VSKRIYKKTQKIPNKVIGERKETKKEQNYMKLTLFFTYGMTLKRWDSSGLFSREVKPYIRLVESGIDVTFVTYGDASEHEFESRMSGIKVIPIYEYIRKPRTKLIRFLHSFYIAPQLIENYGESNPSHDIEEIDILKTNQMWGSWLAVAVKKLIEKPLIVRCGYEKYSSDCQRKAPWWMRVLTYRVSRSAYKNADAVVLSSDRDVEFVSRKFKISKDKISVMSNTIDTELFYPASKSESEIKRILYIGRLTEVKNLHIVIEALSGTGIGFDIYGRGELKKELIELSEKYNVDLKIYKNIPNDKLPDIYRKYPIFVLMSQFEGNSKVLLEAMSSGNAVIASNIPGNSAIIENGVNGIVVEPDPCELRRSIEELMENCELRRKLASNARDTITSKFSLKQGIARELELLKKLKLT